MSDIEAALQFVIEMCKERGECKKKPGVPACAYFDEYKGCMFYARPKDWRVFKEQKNDD